MLVLIDGRSAYTPLWAGVHWPIQDTLLEDVDRIEVIRGPGATVWGANAENGVINIITRPASETHGTYASVASGNVDRALAGARFGGGSGTLDYRAYVKATRREPQFHSDGREFDTWRMGQAGGRVDWHRDRDEVSVTADAYVADLGESVRVATFAPPASFLVDDPVNLHGGNVNARWRRSLSADSDVIVQAYWDHTYRLGTDFGERRDTFDVDAVHRWQPGERQKIVWGIGARTSPGRIVQTYAFSDFQPHDQTLNLVSGFAQDSVSVLAQRLTFVGGLKLEHNSYSGLEAQPSGRVLWRPSEHQTVWGEVTRAVRIPSRVDEDISVALLARPAPPLYAILSGNHDLEAERVIGAEAGYRALAGPRLYVDLTVFHNDYANIIDLGKPTIEARTTDAVDYTAFVFPFVNAVAGVTRGTEIAPDWQPTDRLRVRGSYSLVNIDLHESAIGNDTTLPTLAGSTPRHQVVAQALVTGPWRMQIDPVYRYVSRRAALSVPAYHTADLRLAREVGGGLQLSVVGQNLLQPHHAEWARDPGPTVEIRRSVYVRVTWRR